MVGWICAGYGLLAGVAFFVYLCLFRHVRDNIEGRGSRFLHYFLLSATFYLLSRVTGVNVILGLLPMLVVLHFIGKEGFGPMLLWSAAFGLFSFGWLFVKIAPRVTHPEDGAPTSNVARDSASPSSSSSASKFDLDKYFVSDAVDPTMEFDEPFKAEIDGRILLLPVPKGYTCTKVELEKQPFNFFVFSDLYTKKPRMIVSIPFVMSFPGNEPYQRLRKAKCDFATILSDNPNAYIKKVTSSPSGSGRLEQIEILAKPTIEQNSENDMVSFFSFTQSKNGQLEANSFMESYSIVANAFFEMTLFFYSKTLKEDRCYGFTWLQNFTALNNTIEKQDSVLR